MIQNTAKQDTPGFNAIYIIQPLFNACFHVLRSFFMLYVIWRLGVSDSEAISIFSMFMALCYGTTLLGGYLANASLGIKEGTVFGGVLSILGVLCLFSPSRGLCLLGMALFCVGSGLFKPTLMAAVGLIFEDPKDFRKTKAFSRIYALGNIGMVSLVPMCGFVGKGYGWPYALFIVVSVLVGATALAYKTMQSHKTMQFDPSYQKREPSFSTAKCMVAICALVTAVYTLLNHPHILNMVISISVIGSLIYIGSIYHQCNAEERKDVLGIVGYLFAFSGFVALFEQSGSSLLLFLNKAIDRGMMGIDVPPSAVNAFQPFIVLVCSATLLPLVNWYEGKVSPIQGSLKVGSGFLFVAMGFFILAFGCRENPGVLVPLSWVAITILFKTLGELWIAPISLSKISRCAPSRFHGVLISFWTMAIAYGHCLAGIIAQFSLKPGNAAEGDFHHYVGFFASLGIIALALGLLVFVGRRVLPPLINKLVVKLPSSVPIK